MNKPRLPPLPAREDFDSDEEFALYQSSEAGEWVSTPDLEEQRQDWKKSALRTINGNRLRISIAVPQRNLSRIRSIALRRGIPYQTLINEILHQYALKNG
ncbi:MAG: hypothetical protein LGR52_07515 [Candidatus Thiosymbion ectosymbiont of Robbea hypermnestra]|nr:hypothetical protein [Candidatus Thiosymbion ectosymbiont of Robbea hypermnestra]